MCPTCAAILKVIAYFGQTADVPGREFVPHVEDVDVRIDERIVEVQGRADRVDEVVKPFQTGQKSAWEHRTFIDTHVNIFYMWHEFPGGSALKGGDLQVWAMQAFIALTDRLQFTATSDGYSKIRARALTPDEGWNDLALGLKYNVFADAQSQSIVSAGLSWKLRPNLRCSRVAF